MSSPPPPLRSPSSPSPSTSSPSAPPSPFSRLPDELVQQIIENTVPHHYHSKTYPFRQSTLSSLCLVSKLFHQIAKPLLYALLYCHYGENRDFYGSEHPVGGKAIELSDGDLIREIVTECVESLPCRFWEAISHEIGLRPLILTLGNFDCIDFADLSGLVSKLIFFTKRFPLCAADHALSTDLTSLQLSNVQILSSTDKPLVKLQMLNLLDVRVASAPFNHVLDPRRLPSLVSLAWYQVHPMGATLLDVLGPLVEQLKVVSLDTSSIQEIPNTLLARLKEITLFDHRELSDIPLVPFIRLYEVEGWTCGPRRAPAVLAKWISEEARPGLPSLLHFPTWLKSDTSIGASVEEKSNLEEECKRKAIEIVWEDTPEEWSLESGISENFRRRMKARESIDSGKK